jgi:cell division septal protein FtsQ
MMRFERSARSRSGRAQAHLERMRSRGGEVAQRAWRPAPWQVLAASVALGTLVGSASFSASPIESIHVKGTARLAPAAVAAASGINRGATGSELDDVAIAERIADQPWIAEARVLTLPTGRLLVSVTERVAVATAHVGDEAPYFVDASGTLFAAVGDEAPVLPRLIPATPVAAGEPEPALADAIALALDFEDRGLGRPVEIVLGDESAPTAYAVRLPELGAQILLSRESLDSRLDELSNLLEAGVAELETSTHIDLRFADQAVLRSDPLPEEAGQAAATRGGA